MIRSIFLNLILISFFAFSNNLEAQTQRFKAGVILGGNLSQIDGDNSAGYIKLGLTGGLRGVVVLTEKTELSIELLYDQRGSRSQTIFDENFYPFKITNNYISIPVIYNYKDWMDVSGDYYKLHFHAGLSYGRLIDSAIKDEDINSSNFVLLSEYFNRDDISMLVGATFYTGEHLAITGRFCRSLNYLYRYSDDATDGRPPTRRPYLSKLLTFQLLYMF